MTETQITKVAEGLQRLGSWLINFYLLEERGRVTLFDAGLPSHVPQVEMAVAQLGKQLTDIEAIVLTHGHVDHIGMAERLRRDASASVHIHHGDEQMIRTGKQQRSERAMLPYLRYPTALRLFFHVARSRGAKPRPVEMVSTFSDETELDVPGHPRVLHTPGHSEGHCAFYLEAQQALIAGDALCSLNTLTGRRGPQIPAGAFNVSSAQALASLSRLEEVPAQTLLFGHGEPWTGGVPAAVDSARKLGES